VVDDRIKTELLSSDEQDILRRVNVEVHASGIGFNRKLSEADMRVVAGILISLKNRTKHEGDYIDFALGDWMLQADEWFGKDSGVRWMAEEATRKAYRDHLLTLMGAMLIELQSLENLIHGICSWLQLKVKGKALTVSDFLSLDPRHIKATLGDLKEALRKSSLFDSSFELRLHGFVKKRNRFVHSFWVETFKDSSVGNPPSFETLSNVEKFVSALLKEALEVEAVFRGLHYSLGKEIAERVDKVDDLSNDLFVEWLKYEQDFLSVAKISTEPEKKPD